MLHAYLCNNILSQRKTKIVFDNILQLHLEYFYAEQIILSKYAFYLVIINICQGSSQNSWCRYTTKSKKKMSVPRLRQTQRSLHTKC